MTEERKEWFERWFNSRYYPLLYNNRNDDDAGLLVGRLMAHLSPDRGSRFLDIACGEGRFAWQLEQYGHKVTGIDLSEERIRKAKAMEHEGLSFYVHDMRFPFYVNYFDYAFNFFTSFGYFGTARDNQMAARSFAAALKPGGALVMDYLNKSYVVGRLVPEERVERGPVVFHLKRYLEQGKIVKDILVTDEQGLQHHYQERVSAFGLDDFKMLFSKAGMELTECFGDYGLGPFDESSSPRLIMIFRKK